MANGSFLSEDTYAGNATEPLSLNRYAYVSNNPVNYRDPSGHKRTFSYAMKDAGGGGKSSPSLPQSTVYQPAASQLESAKPKREFEQVAKDAETTGNKPTNSSDKVASGNVEDLKTENEEAKENKGIVATLCDIGSDILQGVVEWFQSEEVQKIIKTIGITVAAAGLALLIGPYIATAIVGVLGLTATTSVTAASIASYMLVAGTTFGTLDSASEGKPFLESLRHGIETGAAWTTIALVLYASYLLVLELIGLVGKITPESIADALDGVYESIQEWFNGDGSNSTTDDIVGDIIEGGSGTKTYMNGAAGELELANMYGGTSQAYFKTSQGGRYIDQLADGIAHESKVGYTTLTDRIRTQILKDAELINTGQIDGAHWHFFTSGVTNRGGASQPLLDFLIENGITYTIH